MQIDINMIILTVFSVLSCLVNLVFKLQIRLIISRSYSLAIDHLIRFKISPDSYGEWTLAVLNGVPSSRKAMTASRELKSLSKFVLFKRQINKV